MKDLVPLLVHLTVPAFRDFLQHFLLFFFWSCVFWTSYFLCFMSNMVKNIVVPTVKCIGFLYRAFLLWQELFGFNLSCHVCMWPRVDLEKLVKHCSCFLSWRLFDNKHGLACWWLFFFFFFYMDVWVYQTLGIKTVVKNNKLTNCK